MVMTKAKQEYTHGNFHVNSEQGLDLRYNVLEIRILDSLRKPVKIYQHRGIVQIRNK